MTLKQLSELAAELVAARAAAARAAAALEAAEAAASAAQQRLEEIETAILDGTALSAPEKKEEEESYW